MYYHFLIDSKLDQETMLEWQRHSQNQLNVPHETHILKFIDLRDPTAVSVTCESLKHDSHGTRKSLKHFA